MTEQKISTRQKILNAGMEEFLEKGFRDASLRQIVKNAGVTTGAFYGYFSSKEALFASIVEPHATALMGRFMAAQAAFAGLPEKEQPSHMGKESGECIEWMLDYIYSHYDPIKLLICCSDGTPYESFVDHMVDVEVEATYRYIGVLRRLGQDVPELDKDLCRMISSGMFNGMFEILRHDMPEQRARRFIFQLEEFHTAGWARIMEP